MAISVASQFSNLPKELCGTIWLLTWLPEPGLYKFNPECFTPLPSQSDWENDRWMIPKHRIPTAIHLCQTFRLFSLHIKVKEQAQEQDYIHCNSPVSTVLCPSLHTVTSSLLYWRQSPPLFYAASRPKSKRTIRTFGPKRHNKRAVSSTRLSLRGERDAKDCLWIEFDLFPVHFWRSPPSLLNLHFGYWGSDIC